MCLITAGHSKICQYNAGGLAKIRIGNREHLDVVTKDVDGSVTAISMVSTFQMYELDFEENSGRYADNLQVGANKYLLQELQFVISGSDQAIKNLLDQLNLGNFFAIVQDRGNSIWHLLGENAGGLSATQGNFGTGTALADLNGADIILQGAATVTAPEVDSAIVDALLSPAA